MDYKIVNSIDRSIVEYCHNSSRHIMRRGAVDMVKGGRWQESYEIYYRDSNGDWILDDVLTQAILTIYDYDRPSI